MSPVNTELINRHLKSENKVLRELVKRLIDGKTLEKYDQGLLNDADIHRNFILRIETEDGK